VVTEFPNQTAVTRREHRLTLSQLRDKILTTKGATKAAMPWLKFARFTGIPNPKGKPGSACLRYNEGVVALTGVEGDYDGGEISLDEAADRLRMAGVAALLYTSASHSPDKPRWRVLCPFSQELPPGDRVHMMDRLNGVLGGILSGESWTLSQSYYFGSVDGKHPVETRIV
jgi:hypothetical protein